MRGDARANDRRVLKANLGFCVQVRRGAIRQSTLAPTPLARVAFVRRCRAGIWHQLMNALTARRHRKLLRTSAPGH